MKSLNLALGSAFLRKSLRISANASASFAPLISYATLALASGLMSRAHKPGRPTLVTCGDSGSLVGVDLDELCFWFL